MANNWVSIDGSYFTGGAFQSAIYTGNEGTGPFGPFYLGLQQSAFGPIFKWTTKELIECIDQWEKLSGGVGLVIHLVARGLYQGLSKAAVTSAQNAIIAEGGTVTEVEGLEFLGAAECVNSFEPRLLAYFRWKVYAALVIAG